MSLFHRFYNVFCIANVISARVDLGEYKQMVGRNRFEAMLEAAMVPIMGAVEEEAQFALKTPGYPSILAHCVPNPRPHPINCSFSHVFRPSSSLPLSLLFLPLKFSSLMAWTCQSRYLDRYRFFSSVVAAEALPVVRAVGDPFTLTPSAAEATTTLLPREVEAGAHSLYEETFSQQVASLRRWSSVNSVPPAQREKVRYLSSFSHLCTSVGTGLTPSKWPKIL